MNATFALSFVAAAVLATATAQTTSLVSVSSMGVQGDDWTTPNGVSADGRFVLMAANATTLVVGDTNGDSDIFVRDTLTGITERVSVAADGSQVEGDSSRPAMSADGRYVAFASDGTDLVPAVAPSGFRQVYRKDRLTGAVDLVSVSPTGEPANLHTGVYTRVSISADGNIVAFDSRATNLVPGMAGDQLYVRNMTTGITVCATVSPAGLKGEGQSRDPALSADGLHLAFDSTAWNLGPVDGNPGQAGGGEDVFVRDLVIGTTVAVNVSSAGVPGNGESREPCISADGKVVAFQSEATNLAPLDTLGEDVFVRDLAAGTTTCITRAPNGWSTAGFSQRTQMSANGRWVIYQSQAGNLVPGDTNEERDVFLHDRQTGLTTRVSVTDAGAQLPKGSPCSNPFVANDGRHVVFQSKAAALVSFPFTNELHVFLRDLGPWTNEGFALAGVAGAPSLAGQGSLQAGSPGSLTLAQAAPLAPALMFISLGSSPAPFKGGTLVAFPAVTLIALATNGSGGVALPFTWPAGIPGETELWFQVAIQDVAASSGVALSNGTSAVTP